ncbi:MAG: hypothetical protein IJM49_03185 [Firmicutes bacterium]|nr:hypothetical protein [Bacillota bacterium]
MRLLVLISGILISGAGAFCFAFYTSTFYDVAFLVGMVMVIAGACNTIAYLVSGRGARRLTETTLVEGLVTLLYGFAVLSNQVTESMLTMFFGTWLTLCGVTRFSQSLYVSRFNPRDWSKIIPLSAISSMLGIVMMLPWLVSSVMPLMLVGGAFLLDGLSMIIYAMYMKDSTQDMAVGEARAKARAEARKEEHEAKLAERERLRNLSKEEREKEEKRRRKAERAEEKEKAQARAAARAAFREAVRPVEERTIRLAEKEVEEINSLAEDGAAQQASEPVETVQETPARIRPEGISSLISERLVEERRETVKPDYTSINAVNLEELEERRPPIEFEKVELPEIEFASDKEKINRESLIKDLENMSTDAGDTLSYKKVDLKDIFSEPSQSDTKPEPSRFTQTLDFSWVSKVDNDLNKEDDI